MSLKEEKILCNLSIQQENLSFPDEMIFEPTDRCNMRCKMCFYAASHFASTDEMSLEQINACINRIPNSIKQVNLIGGEPLMHPNISEIIEILAKRGFRVGISTNGYFLSKELCDQMHSLNNIDYIAISLDGPPEIHNKIRGLKDAFEISWKNIKYASNFFHIHIVTVWSTINTEDILNLIPYLKELNNITYSVEIARDYPDKVLQDTADRFGVEVADLHMRAEKDIKPIGDIQEQADFLRKIRQQVTLVGIPFHFIPENAETMLPNLLGKNEMRGSDNLICKRLFKSRLDPRGNLIHCYALRMPLGSLVEDKFETVWNGSSYKSLRKTLVKDGLADICKYCFAAQPSEAVKPSIQVEKARFGIVGCGLISGIYAQQLTDIPNCNLIGVTSRDTIRGRRFAAEYGTGFFPFEDLVKESDALIVATEPDSHLVQLRALIKQEQIPHILLEKPISSNVEDALDIRDLFAPISGVLFGMSSQMRFSPLFKLLRADIIRDSIVGPVNSMKIACNYNRPEGYYSEGNGWRMKRGGNVIFNQGIHLIDFLVDLLGLPDTVECTAESRRHTEVKFDTVIIKFSYKNPLTIYLKVTTAAPKRSALLSFDVKGDKGVLHISSDRNGCIERTYRPVGLSILNSSIITAKDRLKKIYFNHVPLWLKKRLTPEVFAEVHNLTPQLNAFIWALRSGNRYPVSMMDGLEAIIVATATQVSIEEKRPVKLDQINLR